MAQFPPLFSVRMRSCPRWLPNSKPRPRLALELSHALADDRLAVARLLVSKRSTHLFGATEFQLRDLVHRLGAKALQVRLAPKKQRLQGASVTCPHGAAAAPFHGYRPFRPVSLLGGIRCARAYYYCGRCGRGFFPFDAQAGFQGQRLTAGAERVVSLLGLLGDGFEDAARRVLPEATGLHLGESTAQHSCEDAGDRRGEWLDQGATLGDDLAFDWHEDARGRRCAYVSLDATSVPPQGPEAGPAEGRMPYGAMLYNPAPEPAAKPAHPSLPTPGYEPVNEAPAAGGRTGSARPADEPRAAMEARYLAGLYELGEWGVLLRRQAAQVGMEQADLWIALADAGGGLEDFLRRNFNRPDLVVLRDFHHPTGYLERRALAGHGPGTEAARRRRSGGVSG